MLRSRMWLWGVCSLCLPLRSVLMCDSKPHCRDIAFISSIVWSINQWVSTLRPRRSSGLECSCLLPTRGSTEAKLSCDHMTSGCSIAARHPDWFFDLMLNSLICEGFYLFDFYQSCMKWLLTLLFQAHSTLTRATYGIAAHWKSSSGSKT